MSNGSVKAGLRALAVIEATKGVLVLAAGLGLFAVAHRDLQSVAEELVKHFHLNPARHFPRIFLHLAANLNSQKLWLLAAGATVYSVIRFMEAYGLWHEWKWMKWFAALSGGIYLPVEFSEVLCRFSWARLIVFAANLFVVAFILFHVGFERGRNIRQQAKPPSEANSLPDPFGRRSQKRRQWTRAGGAGKMNTKTCKTTSRANRSEARCDTCHLNRVEAGVAVRIKRLCASPDTQIRLLSLVFAKIRSSSS